MVAAARRMMQDGQMPSVSEVAEQADVSRSTAYRYFPTQSAMVQAVVAETLGPILEWQSSDADIEDRVAGLFHSSMRGIFENETVFRAALRQSLAAVPYDEAEGTGKQVRGHRRQLIDRALATGNLEAETKERLAQALSILFGIESIIVLRDIWGLADHEIEEVCAWAASALIEVARRKEEEKRGKNAHYTENW